MLNTLIFKKRGKGTVFGFKISLKPNTDNFTQQGRFIYEDLRPNSIKFDEKCTLAANQLFAIAERLKREQEIFDNLCD